MFNSVARKIALITAGSVVVAAAAMGASLIGLSAFNTLFQNIVEKELPASAAAYELEINTVEIGLAVLKYLETGNPIYREKVQKDAGDFNRFKDQFLAASSGEARQVAEDGLNKTFLDFLRSGHTLMDRRDQQHARTEEIYAVIIEMDDFVDTKLLDPTPTGRSSPIQLEFVSGLDDDFAEIAALLGRHLFTGHNETGLKESIQKFKEHIEWIKKQKLSAKERSRVAYLEKLFLRTTTLMDQVVPERRAIQEDFDAFLEVRKQMDDLLDDQLQLLSEQALMASTKEADKSIETMLISMGVLTAIFAVFSITAAWVVRQVVVQPVKALMHGTAKVGDGDLSYRIPVTRQDEFGLLAENFNHMVHILQETTVSKQRLEDSEQRFRLLVEGIRDYGLFMLDTDGQISKWTAASEQVHGYPSGLMVGTHFSRLFNPKDLERELPSRIIHAAAADGHCEFETRMQRADGNSFEASIAVSSLYNTDGSPQGYAVITRNITERKRSEAAVRKLNSELEMRVRMRTAELTVSNQELEAFSYSVAHDLVAPLRAMDGFANALLEDHAEKLDESGRQYLDRIRAAALRMHETIDDLLRLARISREKIERVDVNLATIAEESLRLLRRAEPDRNVEVTIDPDLNAHVDRGLFTLALDNLLRNAWKFTGKRETALIELGQTKINGEDVFFVKDNGAGFDMRYADKLFRAFHRLHAATDFDGSGIGLAIVSRVVQRHGGRVWAEAKPEEGATFFFTIPES